MSDISLSAPAVMQTQFDSRHCTYCQQLETRIPTCSGLTFSGTSV